MGLFESLLLLLLLLGICHTILLLIEKFRNKSKISPSQQMEMVEEELLRRKNIINRIDMFLRTSQFIDPIANWRDEKVYRYILNNGYLYEFDDFMTENNQRIGMDEDFLCFKQMTYKRVNNPQEFLENLSKYNLQGHNSTQVIGS